MHGRINEAIWGGITDNESLLKKSYLFTLKMNKPDNSQARGNLTPIVLLKEHSNIMTPSDVSLYP